MQRHPRDLPFLTEGKSQLLVQERTIISLFTFSFLPELAGKPRNAVKLNFNQGQSRSERYVKGA